MYEYPYGDTPEGVTPISEADFERKVDTAVLARLRTDSAYRNAENAEQQEEREEEIANEEIASLLNRYIVVG